MKRRSTDVVVVGAGVIGLFTAFFLARRGLNAVVVERKLPGSGSSTRNGGGVRSQLGTETNIRLSVLSERFWAEFESWFGFDPDLRRIGYLFLASEPSEFEALERQVALQRELGVPSELLSREDVAARWPRLAHTGTIGASFCRRDGFLNQHRLLAGLVRSVEAAGVSIECGVDAIGVELAGDRVNAVRTTDGPIQADVVVNCAGAWAPALSDSIGHPLPITSRRVQLLHAVPPSALPTDWPWLIDLAREVHVRPHLDGRVQVGGFLGEEEVVDPDGFDHDADEAWIVAVLERASETFGVELEQSSVIESWAGLYPCTPDQHPIIDRTEAGVCVVGGFAGLGLMHGPAAGVLAAELIVDGEIGSIDASELSLARFSEPREQAERTGF